MDELGLGHDAVRLAERGLGDAVPLEEPAEFGVRVARVEHVPREREERAGRVALDDEHEQVREHALHS